MYYNWYDPATGEKLTEWPPTGDPVYPFLSSVDNGWLATALIMVSNTIPQLRDQAEAIVDEMDFGFYYDPGAGLLRGGFWPDPPPRLFYSRQLSRSWPGCLYTCHHYGSLNTEPRIASYIAIAKGHTRVPLLQDVADLPEHVRLVVAGDEARRDTRTYLGVDVFEGHYTYRGMDIVPSWGGSMFEALMVPLFVPEEEWGPQNWGVNHPLYVRAQIEHGLEEAEYGYWGFSPSNNPAGGYREYGVDPIGLNPDGYASDQERTLVDYGFEGCRPGQPPPAGYGQGVVTPHASFLALEFAPNEALDNLDNLREDFDAYGWGGFYDSIDVTTGQVSRYYLALDQGMVMASLGNELTGHRLQRYFSRGAVERAVRPLLAMEEFTAGG